MERLVEHELSLSGIDHGFVFVAVVEKDMELARL